MRTTHGPGASTLVVSVREIVRKPGVQMADVRTLPAPADLGTEFIGVPEGSDLGLDLTMDSVSEGIWVSGTVTARAVGECGRCLDEVTQDVVVAVQGLFVYPDHKVDYMEAESEDDVFDFDGENVDLEEMVRDAVVTSLPFTPLCEPSCPGLCDQCGVHMRDNEGHRHDAVDPRWAALSGINDVNDKKET